MRSDTEHPDYPATGPSEACRDAAGLYIRAMSAAPSRRAETRDASMEVAEHAREATRTRPSLAAGIFLGTLEPALVLPFPEQDPADRSAAEPFLARLKETLERTVDPDRVDREGRLAPEALEALHAIGAFRLKIAPEYGGLGFSQQNYNRVVALTGAHCASTAIWLSAHQSIGVPNPLAMVGTEAQKRRWLPRLAGGALSAFALTEPEVGSDPARMRTRAEPHPEGGWTLKGEKLWCTNGPVADVMIVMARTPIASRADAPGRASRPSWSNGPGPASRWRAAASSSATAASRTA